MRKRGRPIKYHDDYHKGLREQVKASQAKKKRQQDACMRCIAYYMQEQGLSYSEAEIRCKDAQEGNSPDSTRFLQPSHSPSTPTSQKSKCSAST